MQEGSQSKKKAVTLKPSFIINDLSSDLLLDFLRIWDKIGQVVLHGFRPNAKTVKSPVVLQRLIHEIERNTPAMEALFNLWHQQNKELADYISSLSVSKLKADLPSIAADFGAEKVKLILSLDKRVSVRKLALLLENSSVTTESAETSTSKQKPSKEPAAPAADTELVNRLKRQISHLEEKNANLQNELASLKAQIESSKNADNKLRNELSAARKEIAELRKNIESLTRRAERAEKRRDDLENEKAELLHENRLLKKAKPSVKTTEEIPMPRKQEDVWPVALVSLLKKKRYDEVILFCEEMAAASPENPDPRLRDYGVKAARALGDIQRVLDYCRWLSKYYIDENRLEKAAYYCCLALAENHEFIPAREDLKFILQNINLDNPYHVSELRHLFVRLRNQTEAYAVIQRLLKDAGRDYQKALEIQTPGFTMNKAIAIDVGGKSRQITIQKIIDCINCNKEREVALIRQGVASMRKARPDLWTQVRETLEGFDPSYESILCSETTPVVVDGSNVAYMLQNQAGRPRLRCINMVRRALREMRFWPIIVIADSALVHQIVPATEFSKLVDAGEVLLADPGTDADELLLKTAAERNCPLVTNDQMLDWDPQGTVPKIRFNVYDDRAVIFVKR